MFTYSYHQLPFGKVRDTKGADGSQDVHGAVCDLFDVPLPVTLGQTAGQHVGISDRLHLRPARYKYGHRTSDIVSSDTNNIHGQFLLLPRDVIQYMECDV